ncbi:hypothetical protein NMG60_11002821 [Bertholletia excelsa]
MERRSKAQVEQSKANSASISPIMYFSPRKPMSSLQRWSGRVGQSDRAGDEIVQERIAAIQGGNLKGRRRLFGPLESATKKGSVDREELLLSFCSDLVEENEIGSVSSCGFGDEDVGSVNVSSAPHEERREVVVERDRVEVNVGGKRDGSGARLTLLMGWFSIAIMVLTLGIISLRCSGGGYVDEDEVILVPT